ncbi:MAG: hypothetical protein K8R91_01590, partial [Phycisphaerae bacterium]|nr:hypothetical protein [Phycisphaerae bacterium]
FFLSVTSKFKILRSIFDIPFTTIKAGLPAWPVRCTEAGKSGRPRSARRTIITLTMNRYALIMPEQQAAVLVGCPSG